MGEVPLGKNEEHRNYLSRVGWNLTFCHHPLDDQCVALDRCRVVCNFQTTENILILP